MATSVLSSLFANSPFRIYDLSSPFPVARSIKIVKVAFQFEARLMRHMREDGKSIVDARVIMPTRCDVDLICPTLDAVEEVLSILNDREALYSVQSKGVVMRPCMLEYTTMAQTPQMMSASPMRISFKSLLVEGQEPIIVRQQADSRLIDRGLAAINRISDTVSDAYSRVRSLF